MARGKKPLNPIQQTALDTVRTIDAEWRTEKTAGWVAAKRELDRKIAALSARRDAAVLQAVKLGVPKVVVSAEGLLASPNSVYDIIKAYAGQTEVADQLAPTARYTLGEVYMPGGQANPRYLSAVVWVLDRNNPTESTTAPIGDGLTYPGQRYVVSRAGELDDTNATFTFTPAPGENDGELRDLLEEFGKGMARRYKYLGSEVVQNVQEAVADPGSDWTSGLPASVDKDWEFMPPGGWDENDAGSLDDIE